VVKHVHAIELRVVVAAALAVAVDAVLVAKHLLKLGAHLATALARLHIQNLARRSNLEAGAHPSSTSTRTLLRLRYHDVVMAVGGEDGSKK
jgi:hypothetical protein